MPTHPKVTELSARLLETVATPAGTPAVVRDALELCTAAHEGQLRKSGEPYVCHPIAVAITVAELGLDGASIAAALCHDVVEDCDVTLGELEETLGSEVAGLVDGVTKVHRVLYSSDEAAAAASTMKLLVALSSDVRVLLIKLADRWHNMSTLYALPEAKQHRIAAETLETYAPLAHRLGLDDWGRDLEDLAFSYCHPDQYRALTQEVSSLAPRREEQLASITAALKEALAHNHIDVEITSRAKGLWSTWSKMTSSAKSLEALDDLVGLRIVTATRSDCYAALGVVHELWAPRPGSFSDYIAAPKTNGYQSLHTTIVARDLALEVQIRTTAMDEVAHQGVAAHFAYKAQRRGVDASLAWIDDLGDSLDFLHGARSEVSASQFFKELRDELVDDEIYAFTPKGKLITLPAGACALDFAYVIHTDLATRAIGARVNAALVSLTEPLHSGDTVEVLTSTTALPRHEWVDSVVTAKARTGLRRRFHRLTDNERRRLGRDLLSTALLADGRSPALSGTLGQELVVLADASSLDSLCEAISSSRIDATELVSRLQPTAAAPETPNDQEISPPIIYGADGRRLITLSVTSVDRTGLLRDCADALFLLGVSIEATRTGVGADRLSRAQYLFFLADDAHLSAVVEALLAVPSVVDITINGTDPA